MLIDFGEQVNIPASILVENTPPQEPQEEEEVDDRTSEEILLDMNQIDEEIVRIRFDKSMESSKILELLVELMEKRNVLSDKLQQARASEYKTFVDSLDLKKIHIIPFFPAQRKCKLRVSDDDVVEIVNHPPQPKKKPFGKYEIPSGLAGDNFRRCEARYKEISSELDQIVRKRYLSPSETAKKLALEAEVAELMKFLPKK